MINYRQLINQLRVAYAVNRIDRLTDRGAPNLGLPISGAFCTTRNYNNSFGSNLHHPYIMGCWGHIPFTSSMEDFVYQQAVACSPQVPLIGLSPVAPEDVTYCFPIRIIKGRYLNLLDFSNYNRTGYRLIMNQGPLHVSSWYYRPNGHVNILF